MERETYMFLARFAIGTTRDREHFVTWWKDEAGRRAKCGLTKDDEAELAALIKRQIGG